MKSACLRIKALGTDLVIWVWHSQPEEVLKLIEESLMSYNQRFSVYDSKSELSVLNQKASKGPVPVQPDLFALISIGLEHSRAPGSNLNIALEPVLALWRKSLGEGKVPEAKSLKQALALTDPNKFVLDSHFQTVSFKESGMSLNLGALAKGYIADCLKNQLCQLGAKAALINLGGNLLTLGHAPHQEDGFWHIGIQNPLARRGEVLQTLKVRGQSLVTSGITERYQLVGGKAYHHILSPKTAYPIESQMVSLTISSPSSLEAEIWTSRLFGKTLEEIERVLTQNPQLEAWVFQLDRKLYHLSKKRALK